MRNTIIFFSIFFLLIVTNHPGLTQSSGTKINYRCWIYSLETGSVSRGFLAELRDSTVAIALNTKRPRRSDAIQLKEIRVQDIRKIALRKHGQSIELAGILGGAVFVISAVSIATDEDGYFHGPGAAIGIGFITALPFGLLGAALGSGRKSFMFNGDLYKYKYQRELMRRHINGSKS